jgi:hypothetical protein
MCTIMTHATSGAKEHGGRKDMVNNRMYYKIQELKTLGYSDEASSGIGIDKQQRRNTGNDRKPTCSINKSPRNASNARQVQNRDIINALRLLYLAMSAD